MAQPNQKPKYPTDLNELAKLVNQANIKWWQNPETGESIQRDEDGLLALVMSELCECLEGERKDLMDDKLPHRKMAEVELADAEIRILDMAGGFGIRLVAPAKEDMEYWIAEMSHEEKASQLFGIMRAVGQREINRALMLIACYGEVNGYDIQGAFEEKMAFNAIRKDHTHEARREEGGKKF